MYVHVTYYYSSVKQRATACWKAPFLSEMLLLVHNTVRMSKAWWHTGRTPEDRAYVETLVSNVSCPWYQSSHPGLPSLSAMKPLPTLLFLPPEKWNLWTSLDRMPYPLRAPTQGRGLRSLQSTTISVIPSGITYHIILNIITYYIK